MRSEVLGLLNCNQRDTIRRSYRSLFATLIAPGFMACVLLLIVLGSRFAAKCGQLVVRAHFFVPASPHVILPELRQALISYQDYHMLLLTLAGTHRCRGTLGRR